MCPTARALDPATERYRRNVRRCRACLTGGRASASRILVSMQRHYEYRSRHWLVQEGGLLEARRRYATLQLKAATLSELGYYVR